MLRKLSCQVLIIVWEHRETSRKSFSRMFKYNTVLTVALSTFVSSVFQKSGLEIKTSRSSRSLVFFEIGFLKNFAIFTGKHLCWSLFAWRSATLLKRHSNTGVFLWILGNFWEHLFLWNTSGGCFWTSLNKIVMKHPWRVAKLYLCWKCSCVFGLCHKNRSSHQGTF